MIVLDTHVLLWATVAPGKLSRKAGAAIRRASELGVSTISFWELSLLAASGRLRFDRETGRWVRAALAAESRLTPLPVSAEIALAAGDFRALRDPGDSIIYATAVEHDAALVTRDERLRELDPVRVVW